MSDALCH